MALTMSVQSPYAVKLPNPNPNPKASYAMPESPTTSIPYTLKPLTLPLNDRSFQRKKYKTSHQPAPTPIPRRSKEGSSLSSSWREIHGANNWEGLLEPLNPLLRDEIVRYGGFISACYKAFDLDKSSKHYLHCKYGRKSMLREVGLGDSGYEVTKYIYAAPSFNFPIDSEMCCSRWLGYLAVSSDDRAKKIGRRDVMVVFRGTVTNPEWMANFMSSLTPAKLDPLHERPDVKVESGFLSLYTSEDSSHRFGISSCREQLLSELSRIINQYKGEEISITIAGHSMGSSIGLLLAYDVAELGLNQGSSNQKIPTTVFSFGGPRVGNSGFKDRCEELGVKVLRVVNVNDPITKLPGVIFNENFNVFGGKYELPWKSSCYTHVGVELALDFFHLQNPSSVHDLDSYIDLLKCPKRIQVQKNVPTIMHRARKSLFSMKGLDSWQWNCPNLLRNAGTMLRVL